MSIYSGYIGYDLIFEIFKELHEILQNEQTLHRE